MAQKIDGVPVTIVDEKQVVQTVSWKTNPCDNSVCNTCFCYRGCGFCICATVFLILAFCILPMLYFWQVIAAWITGPAFQIEIQELVFEAIESNDWSPVETFYKSWGILEHSVLIIGTVATGPFGGLISTRGDNDRLSIELDKKMPVASASKWFSGTIVYAVMEHPLTSLTPQSKPGEYFNFWQCTDPDDARCTSITVENLLAFRSGLEEEGCESEGFDGESWEDCVRKIFEEDYDNDDFDTYEYGPVGLTITGLMALKEMQKLSGYESATWDDLLNEFVIQKVGIQAAPDFDEDIFESGNMTYDFDIYSSKDSEDYNPNFPELSGSLACSPRQYAQFAYAYLARQLLSDEGVQEMIRPRGEVPPWYGYEFPGFEYYAQAMYNNGENVTMSVGAYGFYPWLDQSDPDPSNHHFGILAVNFYEQFRRAGIIATSVLVPIMAITVFVTAYFCFMDRREKIVVVASPA